VGETDSTNFPLVNPFQATNMGNGDGYVTNIPLTTTTTTTSQINFSTYLGGSGFDAVRDVFLDDAGNVYITGRTTSTSLPTTPGVFQPGYGGGGQDAFVAKFSYGGQLIFLTYLGGSNYDVGYSIGVDSAGFIYVSGRTSSSDFPVTPGAFQTTYGGGQSTVAPYFGGDWFVTKIKPDGSGIVWSTYIGGSNDDSARGRLFVDSTGAVYVEGVTQSTNFPTTSGAYQTTLQGSSGGAVVKLSPDGSHLLYSTYLSASGGGVSADGGLAVNSNGEAFVCGFTNAPNFPTTTNAFQTGLTGQSDAFVVRLSADGSQLLASTLLGGSTDSSGALATNACDGFDLDSAGNPVAMGITTATNFPTTPGVFQPAAQGGSDAWVTKLTPSLSSLLFSTYVGTPGNEGVDTSRLVVGSSGNYWFAVNTNSSAFPVTSNAVQKAYGGGSLDTVVVELSGDGSNIVYASYLGGSGTDFGRSIAYKKH
jgi:Beta-propeller repeat